MTSKSTWTFLTNHAVVLAAVAAEPGISLRTMSDRIGITERAVSRIVNELAAEGYVVIRREGRRNSYEVVREALLRRGEARHVSVGQLLDLLSGSSSESRVVSDPAR